MNTSTAPLRIALIGQDLGTSLSPMIHETEAAALGLAGYRYENLDLAGIPDAGARLGTVLNQAMSEGYTGFNVTHPFKQAVIAHLHDLDPVAAALGAVNTLVVSQGRLTGHNTDRSGFLSALQRTLATDTPRRNVVLFGAGGAGAAVARALLDYGVTTLRIIDPEPARTRQLRDLLVRSLPRGSENRVDIGGPDAAREWITRADGIVNATPVGMEHTPGTPFDTGLLKTSHWVADVVYRPVETELLAAARTLGCRVVEGSTMLIEQAADTFALLTGSAPVRQRMRRHLESLLGPVAVPG